MGKSEDDHVLADLPISSAAEDGGGGHGGAVVCGRCRSIAGVLSFKCLLVTVLGVAVFLSAAFWLLRGEGRGHPDPDPQYKGAPIVASFRVQKPVSLLEANIAKLQYDIFDEIAIPNFSGAIIYLEPVAGLNETNVVFGIWPYPKSTTISSTGLSIIREYFTAFVIQESTLHLTTSLFGRTYFFQVIKFPGGITIIPYQSAFLLQKVDMLFNFTLNFPINKVVDKLDELKAQMKSELLLNSYENLYVSLTNLRGSTVAPPTVVQTYVVLRVGNRPPSVSRLKQLAQKIRSSSDRNLGLNHTVFGRVKQIQLSSFLNHSLNSGGNGISTPPSPAPQPQADHNRHHHHHHHHPHPHVDKDLAPTPAPHYTYRSPPPSGCHSLSPNKPKRNSLVPAAAPVDSPKSSPTPAPSEYLPALPPDAGSPAPSVAQPPAPTPDMSHTPLPHGVLAHAPPPRKSVTETKPPAGIPLVSPSPYSSAAKSPPHTACWILVAVAYLLAHLG